MPKKRVSTNDRDDNHILETSLVSTLLGRMSRNTEIEICKAFIHLNFASVRVCLKGM